MYDSNYIDTEGYENENARSSTLIRFRRRQFIFTFLFLLGTLIAAVGWYAEWKGMLVNLFALWLPLSGHALQVIGAFGSLLTPDYIEGDGE